MSMCVNCKYRRIQYAPYLKARVEVCIKQGKCDNSYEKKKEDKNGRH